MEQMQFNQYPETLTSNSSVTGVFNSGKDHNPSQELKDSVMVESVDSLMDSVICDSGSRLIASGFTISNSAGQYF